MPRDDFTEETKRKLADRVGHLCSNPSCQATTRGPNLDPEKATNVGKACHIHAAAEGGPRFDPSQTTEERGSIENGVWLCAICSDKVDKDPGRYSAYTLKGWRLEAELRAHKALGVPGATSAPSDVDRLRTIPVGAEAKLVYETIGGGGYVNDRFKIRFDGMDLVANVFRFRSLTGAHENVDAMPLGDVRQVWLKDDVWFIRTSGYMDHLGLSGYQYRSR